MRRFRLFFFLLGDAGVAIGTLGLAFTALAGVLGEEWLGFALVALLLPIGFALRRIPHSSHEPARHEMAVTVLLLWFAVSLITSVPYLTSAAFTFVDAVFEAVSGFSTTGSTVLRDFASAPHTLLLWRALTQWIGGIGILMLFLAVFPSLAIAGRQLFLRESPVFEEQQIAPRLRQVAGLVALVYGSLTVLCFAGYALSGLSPFEAAAYALSTVGAGGFSPHAGGFGALANVSAEWVGIVFMFLAGVSFPLLFRVVRSGPRVLLRNTEFKTYVGIVAVVTLFVFTISWGVAPTFRESLFHVVSIITSTGFATVDYTSWTAPAFLALLSLMFIGGSVGSASGGVKVLRWVILAKNINRELKRTLSPRAVLPLTIGRNIVPDAVIRSVIAFMMLYVATVIFTGFALLFTGVAPAEAFAVALSHVSNTGPAIGGFGPLGDVHDVPAAGKWMLIVAMVAGRLEIITLVVVFTPLWWRH